jgi:hypothetical protein
VSGHLHAPAALPRERAPGTHFIGGWVDPRAGLDDMEKWKLLPLSGLELPPLLVVQPVASRYTDWAIPAPRAMTVVNINMTNLYFRRKIIRISLQTRYKPTKFMELSPSREVASCAVAQELPNILWNPKVHYRYLVLSRVSVTKDGIRIGSWIY